MPLGTNGVYSQTRQPNMGPAELSARVQVFRVGDEPLDKKSQKVIRHTGSGDGVKVNQCVQYFNRVYII